MTKKLTDIDKKSRKKDETEEELEQMAGGTTEDDVTDAMSLIRERDLLYGDHAILAKLAPIVVAVCKSNKQFPVIFQLRFFMIGRIQYFKNLQHYV